MAKLMTMFFILVALQASLMLYHGTQQPTAIWEFVMNIDNWSSLEFILSLSAIAVAIGLTGISSGSIFGFKTDFLVMAPAIGGLISIGVVFTELANVIRSEFISRFGLIASGACTGSSVVQCPSANFVVALLIGPFALYYVWTVVEWWRGKDV